MLIATYFHKIRVYITNTRALAAVEFALISPILIIILFGSLETFYYLSFQRRAENASASLMRALSEHVPDNSATNIYTTNVVEWQNMTLLLRALMPDIFEKEQFTDFIADNTIDVIYMSRKGDDKPRLKWAITKNQISGMNARMCQINLALRPTIYPFSWQTFPDMNHYLDTIILHVRLIYTPLFSRSGLLNINMPIDKYILAVPRYVDSIVLSNDMSGSNSSIPPTTIVNCP